MNEERIESVGGVKIFVRSWQPAAKPRGIVVICHGVKSHSGYYLWAAEQFAGLALQLFFPFEMSAARFGLVGPAPE